jgi:hypothetical protein
MPLEKPPIEKLKDLIRPLWKYRTLPEKIKYRLHGREVLGLNSGQELVRQTVANGSAALGKIGGTEIRSLRVFLRDRDGEPFSRFYADMLRKNSGVFPAEPGAWRRFCRIYLDALAEMDVLAAWHLRGEADVVRHHAKQARMVRLRALEPYYHEEPWTQVLAGKTVLAVTPFVESVAKQQEKLKAVWRGKPKVAPDFELRTMRIPFHESLAPSPFQTWEEGLEKMKDELARIKFDVAMIGAGAWSLPLAVHAKQLGRVGFHLGGATQVLWGIRGQRWESNDALAPLMNDDWTKPTDGETPLEAQKVEGGSYW